MAKLATIQKFYDHLEEKVQQAVKNIQYTKKILQSEIQHISDLKIKTQQTAYFVNLDEIPEFRDVIIETAQNFIGNCEEYRTRHINKKDI